MLGGRTISDGPEDGSTTGPGSPALFVGVGCGVSGIGRRFRDSSPAVPAL